MIGTGLLPYIRPVDGDYSPGLDEMRAYRPYRAIGLLLLPPDESGFRYAGLTCCVIIFHKVFAIVGRLPLFTRYLIVSNYLHAA